MIQDYRRELGNAQADATSTAAAQGNGVADERSDNARMMRRWRSSAEAKQ
jgi:hypothetical protein